MKYPETAKRLSDALNLKRIKAQELADASGVAKASISQYINGSHCPSTLSAGKMASVLGVDAMWLMGFDVPMIKTIEKDAKKASCLDQELFAAVETLTDADKTHLIEYIKLYKKLRED